MSFVDIIFRSLLFCLFINSLLYTTWLNDGVFTAKELGFYITVTLCWLVILVTVISGKLKCLKVSGIDIAVFLYLTVLPTCYLGSGKNVTTILQSLFFNSQYIAIRLIIPLIRVSTIVSHTVNTLVFSLFAQLTVAFLQYFKTFNSLHPSFNVTGTFFNPGPFGIYVAILLVALVMTYFKSSTKPILLVTVNLLGLIFLLYSLSRTAWMSFFGAIITVVYLSNNHLFQRIKGMYIATRIAVLCGGVTIAILLFIMKSDSATGRILIWQSSLELIHDNPMGVGPGNFAVRYADYQSLVLSDNTPSSSDFTLLAGDVRFAFNDYLQILGEEGIFGLALHILIISSVVRLLEKTSRKAKIRTAINAFPTIILSMLIVIMLAGLSAYPLQVIPIKILFWFLIGLSVSVYKSNQLILFVEMKPIGKFLLAGASAILFVLLLLHTRNSVKSFYEWNKVEEACDSSSWEIVLKQNSLLLEQPGYLFALANLYASEGNYKQAIFYLRKAQAFSPDKILNYKLAECLQKIGHYKEAINQYEIVVARYPGLLTPVYEIAMIYHAQGKISSFMYWANRVIDMKLKHTSGVTKQMKQVIKKLILLKDTGGFHFKSQ